MLWKEKHDGIIMDITWRSRER